MTIPNKIILEDAIEDLSKTRRRLEFRISKTPETRERLSYIRNNIAYAQHQHKKLYENFYKTRQEVNK